MAVELKTDLPKKLGNEADENVQGTHSDNGCDVQTQSRALFFRLHYQTKTHHGWIRMNNFQRG
jgi:hypothetical protein